MVDLSELYGLSESTGYKKFWEMILWIIDVGDVVDFKEDDDGDLEERAQAFRNISNAGIMQGCVAAIDGLLVEIERPNVNDPMKFFSYENNQNRNLSEFALLLALLFLISKLYEQVALLK